MSNAKQSLQLWDGRVKLEVSSGGNGANLLYLHSVMGPAWDPFVAHLAERHTVYAPEFPGTSPGDPYQIHAIDDLSDIVLMYEELIRRLGIDRPVLVGHGFGGMLAAELAAHFPGAFDRMVLLAPLGLWRDEEPVQSLMTAAPDEMPGLLFHDPAGDVARAVLTPPEDPEAAVLVNSQMVWSIGCTGKFLWPIPDRGLRSRLHRVTAETLIVWGGHDRLVPTGYAQDFRGLLPDAQVAIIDEAGHLPQYEQPKQTMAAIDEFLSS